MSARCAERCNVMRLVDTRLVFCFHLCIDRTHLFFSFLLANHSFIHILFCIAPFLLVCCRWAGIAKGVGVQRIIGRIHMVQIQIENNFLTTSFSVLEEQPMDMLLGLDMLKRHQVSDGRVLYPCQSLVLVASLCPSKWFVSERGTIYF